MNMKDFFLSFNFHTGVAKGCGQSCGETASVTTSLAALNALDALEGAVDQCFKDQGGPASFLPEL